jgi:hypothetical protein
VRHANNGAGQSRMLIFDRQIIRRKQLFAFNAMLS